jgi:hypothetical protein
MIRTPSIGCCILCFSTFYSQDFFTIQSAVDLHLNNIDASMSDPCEDILPDVVENTNSGTSCRIRGFQVAQVEKSQPLSRFTIHQYRWH